MRGRPVTPKNAAKWRGPWHSLPYDEVIRRQAKLKSQPKLGGFTSVVERNRVISRMYSEGTPVAIIAGHFGLSETRVRTVIRKIRTPRGTTWKPKGKGDPKTIDLTIAMRAVRGHRHITTWRGLANIIHRHPTALTAAFRKRDPEGYRRICHAFASRVRAREAAREQLVREVRQLALRLGRVPTARDLLNIGKLGQTRVLFGSRGVARLAIAAGLDPKDSRRRCAAKYLNNRGDRAA